MDVTIHPHDDCTLVVAFHHPRGERVVWCEHGRQWRVTVKKPVAIEVDVEEWVGHGAG